MRISDLYSNRYLVEFQMQEEYQEVGFKQLYKMVKHAIKYFIKPFKQDPALIFFGILTGFFIGLWIRYFLEH